MTPDDTQTFYTDTILYDIYYRADDCAIEPRESARLSKNTSWRTRVEETRDTSNIYI